MKRKIKVFSAIASLCLAVALMAFGVYAASTVSYTLNGTVEYTVADALVKIEGKKAYVNGLTGYNPANYETLNYGNEENLTTVDGTTDYTGGTLSEDDTIAIDFASTPAYRFTFTITNVMKEIDAKVVVKITPTEQASLNYKVVAASSNSGTTVPKKGGILTLTYYVYLADVTTSVAAESPFSIALSVTQAA